METLLTNIALIVSLLAIVIQDFKHRAIHIVWLGVLLTTSLLLFLLKGIDLLWLGKTLLFVMAVIFLMWVYICIKQRGVINPFKNHIGEGDLLFFIAVVPLFSLLNYMAFFICGMIFSAVFSLLFLKKMKERMIPLAGLLAVFILMLKGIVFITGDDLFYTLTFL